MPPGPIYNWLCVTRSVCEIISNAAYIRAAQVSSAAGSMGSRGNVLSTIKRAPRYLQEQSEIADIHTEQPDKDAAKYHDSSLSVQDALSARLPEALPQPSGTHVEIIQTTSGFSRPPQADVSKAQVHIYGKESTTHVDALTRDGSAEADANSSPIRLGTTVLLGSPPRSASEGPATLRSSPVMPVREVVSDDAEHEAPVATGILEPAETPASPIAAHRHLQSSKVPSSRIGRLFHYGGLAASLGYGAASELVRRTASSEEKRSPSLMLTEGNIKRLVAKLTQLRGAALKLGQFMSIQDSHVLPPEIEGIFRRVQDSAHYMPDWQMEEVLHGSLGPSWQSHFASFDRLPFAAASIGQVHSAVLTAESSPTGKPARVAVKIQFPNIADSIETDLGYVKMLLTAGRLLPKGLFLDRTIQVMKAELKDECDYRREASFARRFALPSLLGNDPCFKVPWVWDGSTDRVLVMEHVDGVSVGGLVINTLSQDERNAIATSIIDLCLRELFAFRLMQTDPNWTNFLWNQCTREIELVDFGATREYSKEFMDNWLRLLQAAARDDRDECIEWSLKLGYLTGEENDVMLDAHVKSMTLLATPFRAGTQQPVSFGPGSQWSEITGEIRAHIPVMLQHRLTPPPRETYSLNRKLSGAFLLAARLNASVDCKTLWDRVVEGYRFG